MIRMIKAKGITLMSPGIVALGNVFEAELIPMNSEITEEQELR